MVNLAVLVSTALAAARPLAQAAPVPGGSRTSTVIVTMKDHTDSVIQAVGSQKYSSRAQRIGALRDNLKTHAQGSQARISSLLKKSKGSHASAESFWLTNQLLVAGATPELIKQLEQIDNVLSVRPEQVYPLVAPIEEDDSDGVFQTAAVTPQWGVEMMNAPAIWATGNTGKGVTVGVIDTGVRYTHQDLRASWRQNYGWFDPEKKAALPYDATGHGTHVTGIIVGANGIGVAPGAKWIGCKGCRSTGCFASDLLACMQFMLCPTTAAGLNADCKQAPQIVNNSWGGGQGLTMFDRAITAMRAAGIIPVVAAGNTGPNCGTTQSPGDSVNVITVGAVDASANVARYSAKGPTVRGVRKPDVMGPGSSIRSSCWTADNGYCSKSGTSMATPHISGAIALYLSAKPGSTYDTIKNSFQATAVRVNTATGFTCGMTADTSTPNNQFDHGRVDILRALATGVRSVEIRSSCATIEENIDYSGTDVGNTRASTAEACCSLCRAQTNCKAYTWTGYNGGTCWFKSGKGYGSSQSGARSATLL